MYFVKKCVGKMLIYVKLSAAIIPPYFIKIKNQNKNRHMFMYVFKIVFLWARLRNS